MYNKYTYIYIYKIKIYYRIMIVTLDKNSCCFEEDVLILVDLRVCSTKWKKFEGKTVFYDILKCERDMHSVDELVMYLGDISGHVGRHIDEFVEAQ